MKSKVLIVDNTGEIYEKLNPFFKKMHETYHVTNYEDAIRELNNREFYSALIYLNSEKFLDLIDEARKNKVVNVMVGGIKKYKDDAIAKNVDNFMSKKGLLRLIE